MKKYKHTLRGLKEYKVDNDGKLELDFIMRRVNARYNELRRERRKKKSKKQRKKGEKKKSKQKKPSNTTQTAVMIAARAVREARVTAETHPVRTKGNDRKVFKAELEEERRI